MLLLVMVTVTVMLLCIIFLCARSCMLFLHARCFGVLVTSTDIHKHETVLKLKIVSFVESVCITKGTEIAIKTISTHFTVIEY